MKVLEIIRRIVWRFPGEALLVFLLLFTYNNFTGYSKDTIHADGMGYYEYLPAIFIHHDFPSLDEYGNPVISERVRTNVIYSDYEGKMLDKYSCGTALLMAPFFAVAHSTAESLGYPADGYSFPYHRAIFIAAIVYLFLGLYFLKKLLGTYQVGGLPVFILQFLLVFGTNLFHYVNRDASYSHIYSFFVITVFAYAARLYFLRGRAAHFLLCSFLLGLIYLIRPVNIIVILFLPFLAGSWPGFSASVRSAALAWRVLLPGALIFFLMVFVQCLFWYYQTGHLFIYPYQGESFNFLSPHITDVLFSYGKGWFVYTPLAFIAVVASLVLVRKKAYFLFFSWWMFFIVLTWMIASWWCWWYGGSFGQRPFIDFYALLFLPLGLLLHYARSWRLVVIGMLCMITVPLNVVQTWQYTNYVLKWDLMNKENYWNVFMRTEDRFKGMLWKTYFNVDGGHAKVLEHVEFGKKEVRPGAWHKIYVAPLWRFSDTLNLLRINVECEFDLESDAFICVTLRDTVRGTVFHSTKIPLVHFAEKDFGSLQMGQYFWEVPYWQTDYAHYLRVDLVGGTKPVSVQRMSASFFNYSVSGLTP